MSYIRLTNNERVRLIIPDEAKGRLSDTSFRGSTCRRAGNLFLWNSPEDFFKDNDVRRLLRVELDKFIGVSSVEEDGRTPSKKSYRRRIELAFKQDVGWDRVMYREHLEAEDLEVTQKQQINGRASALFLPDGQISAPMTDTVTILLTQRANKWRRTRNNGIHWVFLVYMISPGEDTGKLQGDMTSRHGLVFLNYTNPGERQRNAA